MLHRFLGYCWKGTIAPNSKRHGTFHSSWKSKQQQPQSKPESPAIAVAKVGQTRVAFAISDCDSTTRLGVATVTKQCLKIV